MHLRRVRIYGFKSFSQDVSIDFEPGITALVGPNGGGKSNVVDAVRWALGEQRLRELRAERWDDLLYQGGPERPAARMAEVTLEFDNQDGEMPHWPESLTLARRYYRNGDSEYLINGRPVRLKDITDLFLDSGLGRFNYAIISQGRVEGALLMKPAERLEQLEEAAGVSRYKVRKKETLTHLRETKDKLVRLEDLLNEVRRQMDEVRERAETESRYRTWEMLRQDWQKRLGYTEFRRAMDKKEQLLQLQARLAEERGSLTEELTQVLTQVEELRRQIEQDSTAQEREAEELKALAARETEFRLKKTEIDGRLSQLLRERQTLTESLALVLAQAEELAGENAPGDDNIPDLPDLEQAVTEARAQWERLRRERQLLQQTIAEKEAEAKAITNARGRLDQRFARLQGILHLEDTDDGVIDAVGKRQAEADHLEQMVRHVTAEVARWTDERIRLKQFAQGLEQEIYGVRHQLAGRQARLRALHQLDAEGAGLSQGVRAVLKGQQEGKLQGVIGTLASLIRVPGELSVAVETALGGSHQDVVMENEAAARRAVQYLKVGSLGRATFLPLDTVRTPQVNPDDYRRLGREAGVVGWAADLVDADASIRPAVRHILARVLVVQNLDEAGRLGSMHRFRYKMVTLDGQVVHAGGAITGGSRLSERRSQNTRQVEIDELTRRVREDSEVLAAKEDLLKTTRDEADEVERQLDAARELLADHRHRWQELGRALAQYAELGSPHDLVREMAEMDDALNAIGTELGALPQKAAAMNAEVLAAEQAARQAEARLSAIRQTLRERELIRQRIDAELTRLSRQESAQRQRLSELEREEKDLMRALNEASHALEQAETDALAQEKARLSRVQELKARRDRLVELENRQRVLESEDRKMEHKSHTWNQEVLAIEVRFESYRPPQNVEVLSRSEEENARREVQRITASLNEIGSVVPGSLALFEQLGERRQYLERESDDVRQAQRELEATLDELDEEMQRRVRETAAQVEHAFSEACRQLYGGGDGGFNWVSGDNAGVDLWVRPPGKRPSHLGLLSGGEKALGGVAWLFALLAVRPSPFVVLDEVEASLDEANAMRFAQYIRVARERAQYVIVTHQRETMEAADALWGVAGDGQGQSRLLSVRLTEIDAEVRS